MIHDKQVNCLDVKYYTSDKDVGLYDKVISKRYKNASLVKFFNLIGAPEEFIVDNHLKEYKLRTKNERTSRVSK